MGEQKPPLDQSMANAVLHAILEAIGKNPAFWEVPFGDVWSVAKSVAEEAERLMEKPGGQG